jgi:hypothetical protein
MDGRRKLQPNDPGQTNNLTGEVRGSARRRVAANDLQVANEVNMDMPRRQQSCTSGMNRQPKLGPRVVCLTYRFQEISLMRYRGELRGSSIRGREFNSMSAGILSRCSSVIAYRGASGSGLFSWAYACCAAVAVRPLVAGVYLQEISASPFLLGCCGQAVNQASVSVSTTGSSAASSLARKPSRPTRAAIRSPATA